MYISNTVRVSVGVRQKSEKCACKIVLVQAQKNSAHNPTSTNKHKSNKHISHLPIIIKHKIMNRHSRPSIVACDTTSDKNRGVYDTWAANYAKDIRDWG